MTTYSIDLGFNLEQTKNPGNKDEALLAYGITFIGDYGNPVARLRQLTTDDTIKITVYQLGRDEDRKLTEVTDMSFSISFVPSRSQQEHSKPVNGGDVFKQFKIFGSTSPKRQSTVFAISRPLWFIELDPGGRTYPQGQLQSETKPLGDDTFRLVNEGDFYFTMLLKVIFCRDGVPDQSRIFRVDPEMIVSTSGGLTGGSGND